MGLLGNFQEMTRLIDPFSAFELLRSAAARNTGILMRIFGSKKRVEATPELDALRQQLNGHVVQFDQNVVPGAELLPSYTDVDVLLAGDDVFT